MQIKRTLTIGHIDDKVKQSDYTKNLSGEERISLLEELRYDLAKLQGYDYSGKFERTLTIIEPENH
jgi:hypothetical protein